jgi:hypothetical protein
LPGIAFSGHADRHRERGDVEWKHSASRTDHSFRCC